MKITIAQNTPGYEPEFWGFSISRKNATASDGGWPSRALAVDAAKTKAAAILEAEGWDEEEITEKIDAALSAE